MNKPADISAGGKVPPEVAVVPEVATRKIATCLPSLQADSANLANWKKDSAVFHEWEVWVIFGV